MLLVGLSLANCKISDHLTLTQIRDNVGGHTLTSATYTDTVNMTVESCVNFCNGQNYIYAGVEYAQECCKYRLSPISVVLNRRGLEHKIAGISYQMGARRLRVRIVTSHARVMQARFVVRAIAWTCTRAVPHPRAPLSSCRAVDLGFP
jgi:WSC domain